MHCAGGLRKEKKNNKNEITDHVDALDIAESCLQEKEDKSCVVAEQPCRSVWFRPRTF